VVWDEFYKMAVSLVCAGHQISKPIHNDILYEIDPADLERMRKRCVWKFKPNSMIVRPCPEEHIFCPDYIEVWSRAWSAEVIVRVVISIGQGYTWMRHV